MQKGSLAFFILLLFFSSLFAPAQGGSFYVPLFWFSPCGGKSSSLLSTFAWTASFSSGGGIIAVIGPLYFDYPYIYSRAPPNGYLSSSGNATLECSATDANWLYNISFYSNYSGSWGIVNYSSLIGHADSSNYTVSFTSDYYWYCVVCDALGYCTQSPTWVIYYNASLPQVILLSPPNSTTTYPALINFSCRAESAKPIDNITIYIWKDNSLYYSNSTLATSNNYTANFTLFVGVGNYSWNCRANNSDGYSARAPYNFTLRVLSPLTPTIFEAWARPPVIINGSTEYLYINATQADILQANVTLPNGTVISLNLTNGANFSFNNTNLTGLYNVTFIALNSTTHAFSTAQDSFIAVLPLNFNLTVVNSSYNGTPSSLRVVYEEWVYADLSSPTGNFLLTLPNYTYNVTITSLSSNARAFFENFSLSQENNKLFGMDKKQENESLLYGFNSSFTSPLQVVLYLPYSPLSTPLSFIHCSPFDFSSMSCSSGSSFAATLSGGDVVVSLSSLGVEGFKIIQEEIEEEGKPKKRFNVSLSYTGCLADGITFNIIDSKTGEAVEGRVFIRFDSIYSEVKDGSKVTFYPPYAGEYYYQITATGYKSREGHFSLEDCFVCSEDDDCASNQRCEDGKCVDIQCECGIATNHQCYAYECCSSQDCETGMCFEHKCVECKDNNDCPSSSFCNASYQCEEVECGCGYVENHVCHAYECCSDSDCGEGYICEGHQCELYDIEIEAPPNASEGEEISIQLTINGEPIPDTDVVINGKHYTTDSNGFIHLVAPPEDLRVEYLGRVKEIKVVPVIRNLQVALVSSEGEFFKDVPVTITLRNSKGEEVVGDIIIEGPDGKITKIEGVSKAKFIPYTSGRYKITGLAKKHHTSQTSFVANSCELSLAGKKLDYGRYGIGIKLCWYWWVALALISYLLYRIFKKKEKGGKKHEKK